MPQHTEATRSVNAQRKLLRAWISRDPKGPYHSAVRRAFIDAVADWYVCADDLSRVDDTNLLEKRWRTLAGLLFARPPSVLRRDWHGLRIQPQIVRVLRHSLREIGTYPSKGRPRGDLPLFAIRALDLKHKDVEKWTWHELGERFGIHRCRERGHDPECQKKWQSYRQCQKDRNNDLRRETQLVKKLLRELGIKVREQRK